MNVDIFLHQNNRLFFVLRMLLSLTKYYNLGRTIIYWVELVGKSDLSSKRSKAEIPDLLL